MMVAILAWSAASEKGDGGSGGSALISPSPAGFRGGEEEAAAASASGLRGGVGFGASRRVRRQPPKYDRGASRFHPNPTGFGVFPGPLPG
jgi:hypothetical protein